MKKVILAVAVVIIGFAALLPFASTTPDGLELLTEDSGNLLDASWNGFMAEYSVALGDPYLSALVAGLLGVGLVFTASFALGKVAQKKARTSRKI